MNIICKAKIPYFCVTRDQSSTMAYGSKRPVTTRQVLEKSITSKDLVTIGRDLNQPSGELMSIGRLALDLLGQNFSEPGKCRNGDTNFQYEIRDISQKLV